MTLTREFHIYPAYDNRAEGKGQHCVDMLWLIKGDLGVIQFRLFTGWSAAIIGKPDLGWQDLHASLSHSENSRAVWAPMPTDIGYHSPTPMYEGQSEIDCHLLPGGKCYYDGSGLNADRYFSILVHQGGDKLWEALEEYYKERFEKEAVA